MKKLFVTLILTFPLMLFFYGCNEPTTPIDNAILDKQSLEKRDGISGAEGNIVIANRNSGSISVINTKTDEVTGYLSTARC